MHPIMILPSLILLALLTVPVLAQEADEAETDVAENPEAVEDSATEDTADDLDEELDTDELYSEDDDKFIPSEDVAFGQSIPFPTDI
ncbi:MAG: hypothetical protein ACR2RD_14745 [Woeseiaceae bacterium]